MANIMAAFANAEGGLVAVGLHYGAVEGVADVTARVNSWRQAALDFTQPPVRHTFEEVPCVNFRGEPDRIVLIEVESAERVHETVKGETYLRVGDETRRLGPLEAQELRYDKGDSTFDGSAADASLRDVDKALLGRYLTSIGARSPAEAVLPARGLATTRTATPQLTVAGT